MKFKTEPLEGSCQPVELEGEHLMAVAIDGRAHLVPLDVFTIFCRTAEKPPTYSSTAGASVNGRTKRGSTQRAPRVAGVSPSPHGEPAARHPNQRVPAIGQPMVKQLPASGTLGAAILAALAEGKTMTTAQLQASLEGEYTPMSVQAEMTVLHRKDFIGQAGKDGKAYRWKRV